jgi:hypothetical protein
MAGEGFAATCIEDEANKLVEDSAMMARWAAQMLHVDMS